MIIYEIEIDTIGENIQYVMAYSNTVIPQLTCLKEDEFGHLVFWRCHDQSSSLLYLLCMVKYL